MRIPSWYDDAGCRGMDRELFFPLGASIITPEAQEACDACPVRGTCLEWALETGEVYGTWGGLSEKGRSDERRRRVRRASAARAREEAVA